MKKDKEWLVKLLKKNLNFWTYNVAGGDYGRGRTDEARELLTLIDQLEEPQQDKLYIIKFAPSVFGTTTYGSIGTQNGKKIMQSVYGSQEGIIIPNQYTRREIEEVGSKYMAFAEEVNE